MGVGAAELELDVVDEATAVDVQDVELGSEAAVEVVDVLGTCISTYGGIGC